MKNIRNSDAERGLARGGRVNVCPYLAGKGAPIMVGGVRVREHLRDGPVSPQRSGSAGPNGDCEKCGMGCLNFELSAERYQLKKYDKYFF